MLIIIYNLFFLWFLILSYQRTMFLWVQTVREDKKSFRKAIFDIFSSGSKEKWEMLTFPGHHQRSTTILIKFSFFQNLFNCCLFLWSEKFFLRILFCLLIAFTYPKKRNLYLKSFAAMGVKSLIQARIQVTNVTNAFSRQNYYLSQMIHQLYDQLPCFSACRMIANDLLINERFRINNLRQRPTGRRFHPWTQTKLGYLQQFLIFLFRPTIIWRSLGTQHIQHRSIINSTQPFQFSKSNRRLTR